MSVSFSLQERPTFGVMKSWNLNVHNKNKKKKNAVTHKALTNAKTNQNKAREKQKKTEQKTIRGVFCSSICLSHLGLNVHFSSKSSPTLSLLFYLLPLPNIGTLSLFLFYPLSSFLDCTDHVSQVAPKRSNKIPLYCDDPAFFFSHISLFKKMVRLYQKTIQFVTHAWQQLIEFINLDVVHKGYLQALIILSNY